MNFLQNAFSSYEIDYILKYVTGDKNISQNDYWQSIDELITKTDNEEDVEIIQKYIVKKLNLNFEKWKKIYKTLKLLENLLKGGNMKIVYKMRYFKELIDNLSDFKYEVNGAANIREKAAKIYKLLEDDDLLQEERKKYQVEREKELKEEIRREGGLLNSLGTYTFDRTNDKNKYDLTRKKEEEEDEDSDSSSIEDKEKPPLFERKKPIVNTNKKEMVPKNQDLLNFEDLLGNSNSNTVINANQEKNIIVNNNVDLINMDEFLNPVEDNNVKLINLKLGLTSISSENSNNNTNQNYNYNNTQPVLQIVSTNNKESINLLDL